MSSFPTVTITVTGSVDVATEDDGTLSDALHMAYVQATKGDKRQQYVFFPPPLAVLGCKVDGAPVPVYLTRTQEFVGNRSKWFHHKYASHNTVASLLKGLEQDGWEVGYEVAVPLEVDDFVEVYNGETPHKALRAVNRALEPLGVTVK